VEVGCVVDISEEHTFSTIRVVMGVTCKSILQTWIVGELERWRQTGHLEPRDEVRKLSCVQASRKEPFWGHQETEERRRKSHSFRRPESGVGMTWDVVMR